jgi:hypothetical protein
MNHSRDKLGGVRTISTVDDGFLSYFMLRMVRRLPMLLLLLSGSAFAIIRWKRHPRVSLMTLLALVIYFVEGIVFVAVLYWLPDLMQPMRLTPNASGWVYSLIFFFEDIVYALVIILLVGAAFTGRRQADKLSPPLTDTV